MIFIQIVSLCKNLISLFLIFVFVVNSFGIQRYLCIVLLLKKGLRHFFFVQADFDCFGICEIGCKFLDISFNESLVGVFIQIFKFTI